MRIIEPGPYTLVVDQGRLHHRGLGVPVGGAADRASLALGNALLGNPPQTPALEFSLRGPTVDSQTPLACAVFGAAFDIHKEGQTIMPGKTFSLHPGEILRIGAAQAGMRGYLCVQGGIEARLILGSRSSLQPLRAGDELPCLAGRIHGRFLPMRMVSGESLSAEGGAERQEIHVLDGLQADWFDTAAFYGQEFTLSPQSNRMGLRFKGEPLARPERELVSEPVCPGAVQVTHDGQCIVLGVDGQTIGGYPKIAHVISADLDRLGQLRPYDRIRFVRLSLDEARSRYRARQAMLREWVCRLRVSLDGVRMRGEDSSPQRHRGTEKRTLNEGRRFLTTETQRHREENVE